MPRGLQCFNAQGVLTTDLNDSQTRLIGVLRITRGSSGSIQVPGFSEGTPWSYIMTGSVGGRHADPKIVLTGSSLTWSHPDGGTSVDSTVMYGVY